MKRPAHGPEYHLQRDLIAYLKVRGWLVERIIGNAFQMGLPDLFCFHPTWGARWVDVKVEGKYNFTKAQKFKWPLWETFGLGVWIITSADQTGYDRLFAPPNMRDYWKDSWTVPTQEEIDKLIDEMT